MKSSLPVALVLALIAARAGFAQTLQPTAGLAVYDADGQRVGPVVGGDSASFNPDVALRSGGLSMVVAMTSQRFDGSEGPQGLAFESADCTGTPLFAVPVGNSPPLVTPTIVESETPGFGANDDDALSVVYVPDPTLPVSLYSVRSESNVRSGPRCETHAASPFTGAPARRVVDLAERFRRPLELRAEPAVDLPGLEARVRALEAENAALRQRLAE
jgi:hypothetical protein